MDNNSTNRNQINSTQMPRSNVEPYSDTQQSYVNDRQQPGFSGQQFVQSSIGQYTIKDIVAVLPMYDPADDSQTSIQFIDRIERLRNVYGWNDNVLVFAVLSKLKGYAKRWVDAQPVFNCWSEFVVAFLRDFPCFRTQASAHVQLMNSRMYNGENLIEYYYRVLSLGRRENIDEASIVQYIINGITDENLKRTLIVMHFNECAELLKAIVKAAENKGRQQFTGRKPSEIVSNKNSENREQYKDVKVIDQNRSSNNFICYNCHQRGHISRNCKQPQRNRRNNNVNNLCSNVVDCVENVVDSNVAIDNEVSVTPSSINKVQVNTKAELIKQVQIIGNVARTCNALIDSGSNRSLIRKSIANELGCELIACKETLLGFGGGINTCLQKITVKIKIDDNIQVAELLVVEDNIMSYDIIVGLDVLSKGILIIQNGTCRMMSIDHSDIQIEEKLNSNIKQRLYQLLWEYENCFGENLQELGKSKTFKMKIELTSSKPIFRKPYNIPIPKRVVVEKLTNELLELGIIRHSSSLYASPIVLVRKQNGEDRMCVDFRQLNAITDQQPWCMPTVESVLTNLQGHSYFTTLDLMSGYYQIELEESSKQYTGFVTHNGHFEFNRMPFGLRNAPCEFQKMMSKLLLPLGNEVISYVDEIIIATDTAEQHFMVLEKFLKIMQNEGLTLRISKCNFLKSMVSFLGHVIDNDGIHPGNEKTLAILNYPIPKTIVEVRRFLGLTGFFRKFVQHYAHLVKPLTELLKKHADFIWSDDCGRAFKQLIEILANKPVLTTYDVNKRHELHTDASSTGIAAILLQENEEGKLRPVAYFSRCCNRAESQYHAYELEVLAVVEACNRFRLYLMGKSFKIVTDCESITTAKMSKPMIPRVARWFLRMQEYDYELVHRPGESMKHVDALSRSPVAETDKITNYKQIMHIHTDDWVSIMQKNDPKLNNLIEILMGNVASEQKKQIADQYELKNQRLYYKTSKTDRALVVPKGLRWRIVKMYHDDRGHSSIETVLQKLSQNFWFPRKRNFVKSYLKTCVECAYHRQQKRKGCELYGMDIPKLPFEVMHMDHLGPFPKSKRGFEYVLVCVDALTRYVLIYPTRTTKTKPVVDALNQLSTFFGMPKTIVTDRGTAFTSEKRDWDEHVRLLQWTINTRKNATTRFAPIDLIFDFPLRDIQGNKLLAALHDDVAIDMNSRRQHARDHIEQARVKWKERFDSKYGKPMKYAEGEIVLIESPTSSTGESRKLEPKYKGPFVIKKVLRFDRYVVEEMAGSKRSQRPYSAVIASDKMKPFCELFPEVDEDIDDSEADDEAVLNSGRV